MKAIQSFPFILRVKQTSETSSGQEFKVEFKNYGFDAITDGKGFELTVKKDVFDRMISGARYRLELHAPACALCGDTESIWPDWPKTWGSSQNIAIECPACIGASASTFDADATKILNELAAKAGVTIAWLA